MTTSTRFIIYDFPNLLMISFCPSQCSDPDMKRMSQHKCVLFHNRIPLFLYYIVNFLFAIVCIRVFPLEPNEIKKIKSSTYFWQIVDYSGGVKFGQQLKYFPNTSSGWPSIIKLWKISAWISALMVWKISIITQFSTFKCKNIILRKIWWCKNIHLFKKLKKNKWKTRYG